MKLNKTLFWCALIFVHHLLAQKFESQEVKDWITAHPDVKLVGTKDQNLYTDAEWQDLNARPHVLIYDGNTIDISEIELYNEKLNQIEAEAWVKQWLHNHPGIKVIQKSYFDGLSEERKAVYLSEHVLIISGAMPLKSEIIAYETE